MAEVNSNPGLDALWAYARSLPPKEKYMEKKQTSFDAWWATLTPVEQKVIGRTNAKFVWLEACEACAKVCEIMKPFGPELALQKATTEDCAAAIRERNNP